MFEVGADSRPAQIRWCQRCRCHHVGEVVGYVTLFGCPSLPEGVLVWDNPQERSRPDVYLPGWWP